ncbi:CRTAC1 family protein [Pseudoalteromonas sp. B28]
MSNTVFKLSAISIALCITACSNQHTSMQAKPKIMFDDVSVEVGLTTDKNWKYGGPSLSDLNNDGLYDLLLTNHDSTPVQLFLSNSDFSFTKQADIYPRVDLHGMASGDYDNDGDNDILLSLGGGNGLSPQPQRLLQNNQGQFTDVTAQAGLSEMGARGRSVRWIDLDNDGDLDFMQVNAEKMVTEQSPRNILFENNGNGTFDYHPSPVFENLNSERVLITDFNNDNIPDIFGFNGYSPLVILQGNNDFSFTDVTAKVLPQSLDTTGTLTLAHADIDNDGDMDYYLARGKLHYTIANNSISYNDQLKRLDLRDEGNKSHDGLSLTTQGDLILSDFYHFPRGKKMKAMPVFLGAEQLPINTPVSEQSIAADQAQGFAKNINKTGWYIGHLGNNKWRVEWYLADNLAWDVRASFKNVTTYNTDWTPQDLALSDILLRNDKGQFTDISAQLPKQTIDNNWGVVPGDFNNDTLIDFVVYRFGHLKQRVADVMLINQGNNQFTSQLLNSATSELNQDSHGDMGAAFDYNDDGKLDLLSGDDDNGRWHLYKNTSAMLNKHYSLVRIGYSPSGIDAMGAKVEIKTAQTTQYQVVGSHSANHSQSLMNIAHFGLGNDANIKAINVTWRDGSNQVLRNQPADRLIDIGNIKY